MTCEDCDKFICSQYAKTYHKDLDWKTITTAEIRRKKTRKKELKKTLGKVKNDVKELDKKILMAAKLMEDNE